MGLSRLIWSDDPVAREPMEGNPTLAGEEEAVGEHGRGESQRTGQEHLGDVRAEEGLAAGDEELADAGARRLGRGTLDVLERERPGFRPWGGAHAAVVTGEVAVEVAVEPEPRSDDRRLLVRARRALADKKSAGLALGGHLHDGVPGEASPPFEVGPEASRAMQREEVAVGEPLERREQVVQQAGGKILRARSNLDRDAGSPFSPTVRRSLAGARPLEASRTRRWTGAPTP